MMEYVYTFTLVCLAAISIVSAPIVLGFLYGVALDVRGSVFGKPEEGDSE